MITAERAQRRISFGSRDSSLPGAFLPLKVVTIYLAGTFVLLLMSPYTSQVDNMPLLVLFLSCATGLFALGYKLSIVQRRRYDVYTNGSRDATPFVQSMIIVSSGWFILFSFASLANYGASSIGDIISAALNPSQSYFSKFDVYLEQQLTGQVSLPVQIAVLTGALYGVLIPVTIYYWRSINIALRFLAVFGALSYVAYFVFIGTQKGIGDVLIMSVAALAATVGLDATKQRMRKRLRRGLGVLAILLSLGFVVYLANTQGARIEGTSVAANFEPNPVVTSLFGENFSRGLAVAQFYPTNGYIGLSKDLGVPFVFSEGASVPALASYKVQYLGGVDPLTLSYPVRAEAITGWPAGQYWSTIYAWLASDLTFPGTVLFMGAFGWFTARMWIGIRYERDPLSLVLFCQAAIAVVYIPANNQLMTSRFTALGFLTLLVIYGARRLLGRGFFRKGKGTL